MNNPDFSKMTQGQLLTEFRTRRNVAKEMDKIMDELKKVIHNRYLAKEYSWVNLTDGDIIEALLSKIEEGEKQ